MAWDKILYENITKIFKGATSQTQAGVAISALESYTEELDHSDVKGVESWDSFSYETGRAFLKHMQILG